MRKVIVVLLVVLALASIVGSASANINGSINPLSVRGAKR